MKTLLISSFFTSLSVICFGQTNLDNKIIAGTWINYEFLNCLRTCDSVDKKSFDIQPRFVYIDSGFSFQYENHFEHISRKNKLNYQKPTNHFTSKLKGFYLQLLNDSTLSLIQQDTIRKTFLKISSYSVPGSGMQVYLRTLYFDNRKFWKLIHINPSDKTDTLSVIITATNILSRNRKYISEYEFSDTYQETFKGERLFTVMLFDVDKNYMMVNDRLFRIKTIGLEVNLYNKEKLEYILIPESEQ
jgi:hypothetical protein